MRLSPTAILGFALVAVPLGAHAQSAPSPAPSSSPACGFHMNVETIDAKRVALRFFTTGPAEPISGTAALYAGDRRYDVAFHNAYARTVPDTRRIDVQPVIVRFAEPVTIDAVIITAIDSPPRPLCSEQNGTPFIAWNGLRREDPGADQAFRARVDALPALDAPAPVLLPHTCPVRNAHARTVSAATPPGGGDGGVASVLISLDASDNIVDARIVHSSGNAREDAFALGTARASTFRTEIFNCTKRPNDYIFTVSF